MKQKYDLEDRTAKFGEEIIRFVRSVSKSIITTPLIHQLIKSATSIGANYCEANEAESKRDFAHKIAISKKEIRETRHWLRMMRIALPEEDKRISTLQQEAKELNLIFGAIFRSTKLSLTSNF